MTGFGKSMAATEGGSIQVEIKSLNSKFLDLSLRFPPDFSDLDIEVRNLIQEHLERGKISVTVTYDKGLEQKVHAHYREEMFVAHYLELKKLADRVIAPYDQLFEVALRSPEVVIDQKEKVTPDVQEKLMKAIKEAIAQCNGFRADEGRILSAKLKEYAAVIRKGLGRVEHLDAGRVEKIRNRIQRNVTDYFGEQGFDRNRLEQEILFYVEKLDIHEERVRLRSHLDYFEEAMTADTAQGKKLGFIAQEIGREINTIGSKANDAAIQREVVGMKEELEKIKEQLNNVL
jgi:uncharacterized protein (TIGR00255 family)